MSIRRALAIVARDSRLGLRSSMFVATFAAPVFITLLNALDKPVPFRMRLGILDHGRSRITSAVGDMGGIDLTLTGSVDKLKGLVERHELDAGLVLRRDFDAKVRAGERPVLEFYVSGETDAVRRLVFAVTAIDLARGVAGTAAPVDVVLKTVEPVRALAWTNWKIVFWLMFLLTTAGTWLPALMLVEERESGTLRAILVTPAKVSEVLASRAVLGFSMTAALCYLTLILNLSLPPRPSTLLAAVAVSALVCTELGLVCGVLARDIHTVAAFAMSTQVLTGSTLVLCLAVADAPWIARLVPTYWVIGPLYEVAINGATLEEVRADLAVAGALAAVMAIGIVLLARRMQTKLATE